MYFFGFFPTDHSPQGVRMYPTKKQHLFYEKCFSFHLVLFLFAVLSIPMATFSNCFASQIAGAEREEIASLIPGYLSALPLSFEARSEETEFKNDFFSRGPGYQLSLSADLVVFQLPPSRSQDLNSLETEVFQLDTLLQMEIVNADANASAERLEPLPGKVNYFTSNDPTQWRTNLSTHARVRYSEVYPGIDLEYYGRQGQLEYDFIVSPDSDPTQIRLSFQGVERIEIDDSGALLLHTGNGVLRQKAPFSYQEIDGKRRVVASRFVSYKDPVNKGSYNHDHIGFLLDDYDTNHPLVIDPALTYSTYFGGNSGDDAYSIATDSAGNIYVTGSTGSSDFHTASPLQSTPAGANEVFISKVSSDGSTLIYSTFLGGTGHDRGIDIVVDSAGAAYVTGTTVSSDFPVTTGAAYETASGSYDVFIAKLSAAGDALEYATYLGGSDWDFVEGLVVDTSGNTYVAGFTQSTDYPTSNALYPSKQGGQTDAFVAKLNATGTAFVFSTYLGGISSDYAHDIAIDDSANIYVTGNAYAGYPFTQGAYSTTGGGMDIFITKISSDGSSIIYSTHFGGSDADECYDIALDGSDRAYITGKTYSSDFPMTMAYQAGKAGNNDAFLVQLKADGSDILYSTYLGGSQSDQGNGVAVDSSGSVYVTGNTSSTDFPVKNTFLQGSSYGGVQDGFVSRFNLSQTGEDSLFYSLYLGGAAYDYSRSVIAPNPNVCYMVGRADSVDFPVANPFQESLGGLSDSFIAKIVDGQTFADLSVSVEDLSDPVFIGSNFSYQVNVLNNGIDTATGVVLTYTLPPSLTILSTNASQGVPVINSEVITLDIGSIGYGETVTMLVNVTAPGADTTLSSTAVVASTSADPNETNNSFTEETLVRSQYYTYTATTQAYYSGRTPCGSVVSNPAGIDCGDTCESDFLEDSSLTLTAIFDPETCKFEYWNSSDGTLSGPEVTVTAGDGAWARGLFQWINADLALTSNVLPSPALTSSNVDYRITVEHVGSYMPAENVVFIDTLPPEAVYVSSTTGRGSCSYDSGSHQVTCNIGTLHKSWTPMDIVITVTTPATPGTMTNQAEINNSVTELDLSNNVVTDTTTVTSQQHTLTVNKISDGTGMVTATPAGVDCGGNCNALYPEGTLITLLSAPDPGSFFTGWSGDGCNGMGSCVVHLDSNKTINATFTTIAPPTISLPKTGQTTCFDDAGSVVDCSGTGQDGEVQAGMAWPDPRFELTYCDASGPCTDQSTDCDGNADTDTITDLLTGMMWSRSLDLAAGGAPWQQALDTVTNINATTGLGGYSDWRLPNINELASLVRHQKGGEYSSSWLFTQGFTGVQGTTLWSSTTYKGDDADDRKNALINRLSNGILSYSYKTNPNRVWAVRGTSSGPMPVNKTGHTLCFATDGETIDCSGTGQDGEIQAGVDWPAPRFSVIYGDSTGQCVDQSNDCDSNESTDMVRDNLTGLLLARDINLASSSGNMQAARDALTAVNSGNGLGGYTDWRIPNTQELSSLIDFSNNDPALSDNHPFVSFSTVSYMVFWSSTTADITGETENAYIHNFSDGFVNSNNKSTATYAYLWPVREDTGTADLKLTLLESSDPVQVGTTLTYSLEILNYGPGEATDVSLENSLPPEVSFLSVASGQGSCSESGGVVSCTMDTIERNATSTVTIEVFVGMTPLTVTNSATVTTSKNDPAGNNTITETTRISNTDYTLTVEKGGTGDGDVTSVPAGIDCGSNNCSHLFFETTSVTLDAIADGTSLFMGWDGCDQVVGSQCTVAMAENSTVTALFDTTTTADYYVTPEGNDSYSGLGWSRPFLTIAKALSVAGNGDEIWIKAGTYEPPIVSTHFKSSYFTVSKKLNLYGGFDGSETDRNARDPEANHTIVDARTSGGYFGQGFHVNTEDDSGPGRARIDGFIVRGGWALGNQYPFDTGGGIIVHRGSPIIANCEIKFNWAVSGGGIFAGSGTSIINCRIHHNNAQNYGGGIVGTSNNQVINSAVYSNYSTYSGAGIALWGGGTIDSTTITDNWVPSGSAGTAGFHGYSQGTTSITNSIIWGNRKGDNPSEISTASSGSASANITYSNVRGGYTGTGNIDNEPAFHDPSNGDFKVQPFIPSINAGNNAAVFADIADLDGDGNTAEQLPVDIAGSDRVVTTVDMGAYEYKPGFYTEHALNVTIDPAHGAVASGAGFSCDSSCSVNSFEGFQLTVTATPQSPYRFAYWQGCNSSNWDQCTITMDAAKAITAHMVDEEEDADSDDMLDWWEWFYFHSLTRDGNGDYDGDGLSDKSESAQGTNPDDSDSDGDGMPDGWEVSNTLLPLTDDADLDADSDGLTNLEEYEIGTNPRLEDSDGDGMPDAWEDNVWLDPTVNDASGDADGDGISNIDEYTNGTNPTPLCGDVSDDTVIDLTDLIMVLQVLTGTSSASHFNGDCNSDGKIGLNEGLLILQRVADE